MNTKELVSDTVKRSLEKYHDTFMKAIQRQISSLEGRLEDVEDSALNITELSSNELSEIIEQ